MAEVHVNNQTEDPIQKRDEAASSEDFVDGTTNDPGQLYVIQELDQGQPTDLYKIGVTKNTGKRRNDLQTGNIRELKVIQNTNVTRMLAAEQAVQRKVRRYALQQGGGKEWYRVPQDEMSTFERLLNIVLEPYLDKQ